ncbi:MAG: HAD hydrolase family protein [Clostridiales bacterium]|nr:HAD hydrolase family protein [Clostridiales bacterium]
MSSIQLTQSSNTNIEIMPPGIDKATGLKELADYHGNPLSETMALGDQDNDIPMLMEAGLSVAMENAEPHVKAIAKVVTASNTQDGVAKALYDYVL